MAFKSIFRREEQEPGEKEGFIEIETEGEEKRKINVRIENLSDYRDVEEIQKLVREGNIVFLRMRKLKERDLGELRRSIERLRKTSIAMNGDIVGIDEDYILLTPSFAHVVRQ